MDSVHIGIVRQIAATLNADGDNFEFGSRTLKVYVPGIDDEFEDANNLPDVQVVSYAVASNGRGQYSPFLVGDKVLVTFFGSDTSLRCIIGRFYSALSVPSLFQVNYPHREGFVSQQGHALIFDNKEDLDARIPGGVALYTANGLSIELRDAWKEARISVEGGSSFILRGGVSDPDDPDTVNQGCILESTQDAEGKNFKIQIDDENGEAVVTSREGYTVTMRDEAQATGTEKKGITIRTTAGRSITIDEETGKLYIKHDGEVIVEGSKMIIDSDLDVNGKVAVTGDIEGGGEIEAVGDIKTTFGMVHDVLGNLTTHTHILDIPHNATLPRPPVP